MALFGQDRDHHFVCRVPAPRPPLFRSAPAYDCCAVHTEWQAFMRTYREFAENSYAFLTTEDKRRPKVAVIL